MSRKLIQAVVQSVQQGARGLSNVKKGLQHSSVSSRAAVAPLVEAVSEGRHVSTGLLPPPGARQVKGSRQPAAAASRQQALDGQSHRFADRFVADMGPGVYIPTAEEAAAIERRNYLTLGTLLAAVGGAYYAFWKRNQPQVSPPLEREQLVNWSGTHQVTVRELYQPESMRELEALVAQAHREGRKLRCMGSGLSPNGIAFCEEGMVSLALLDKVVSVDREAMRVTVQAGARVQEVADAIRGQGLTLQNYASIKEQTVGGFTQVGAHGTGAGIPPVDEQVVGLRLITPAEGVLELSKDQDPELFSLAKVGLGCLGVVAEVTLQCVPAERLVEHTFPSTLSQVRKNHTAWLQQHKHLRYMWIPHTDTVIVVTNDPLPEGQPPPAAASAPPAFTEEQRLKPLRDLLLRGAAGKLDPQEVAGLSATQCRDHLLALDPLNKTWVARVNKAEAEYWKRSEGFRVGWSDQLLGFDCGGQQWVLETAFPCGSREDPSGEDLRYMQDLLKLVEAEGVPAPAPIEQRWTSGSSSAMSPCRGPPSSLHSWVGIIQYLPESQQQRDAVTASFRQYGKLVESRLMPRYNAIEHWAKIELPQDPEQLEALRARVATRYPVREFAAARARLDPKGILGNQLMDTLIPAAH